MTDVNAQTGTTGNMEGQLATTALATGTVAASAAPATAAVDPNALKLPTKVEDIKSEFFVGSEINSKGIPTISAIQKLTPPIVNGDWPETGVIPAGYGLLIMPISETVVLGSGKDAAKGRKFKHCIIAMVPTLDVVIGHLDKEGKATGREYVESAVLSAMQAKLRNGLSRIDGEDKSKAKLAFTVDEFLERADRGVPDQGLQAYKKVAPILVKALAKHDINLNMQVLRQVLQQTKFAEALFPNVAQVVWQKVITKGRDEAVKASEKTEIFDKWLAERDTAANETALEDVEF